MTFKRGVLADRGEGSTWLAGVRESNALRRLENTLEPKRLRRCLEVYEATGSLMDAARAIDMGDKWIAVSSMLERLGERKRKPRPRRAKQAARDAQILELRAQGYSQEYVGKLVGCHSTTVGKVERDMARRIAQ